MRSVASKKQPAYISKVQNTLMLTLDTMGTRGTSCQTQHDVTFSRNEGNVRRALWCRLFVDVWVAWVEAGYLVNNNTHDTSAPDD